ncbi:unnamed protein product [Amoebophrya sp. A25]|nr:unnamed protein product [Amoebophrya sp. A25]|eukprot:GSA25T00007726001.1
MSSDFYEAHVGYEQWPAFFQMLAARVRELLFRILRTTTESSNNVEQLVRGIHDAQVVAEMKRWRLSYFGCINVEVGGMEPPAPAYAAIPLALTGMLRGMLLTASARSQAKHGLDDQGSRSSSASYDGVTSGAQPEGVVSLHSLALVVQHAGPIPTGSLVDGDNVSAVLSSSLYPVPQLRFGKHVVVSNLRDYALRRLEQKRTSSMGIYARHKDVLESCPFLAARDYRERVEALLSPPVPKDRAVAEGGKDVKQNLQSSDHVLPFSLVASRVAARRRTQQVGSHTSLPIRCRNQQEASPTRAPPSPAERVQQKLQEQNSAITRSKTLQVAVCMTGRARTLFRPEVYKAIAQNGTSFPNANVSFFYVLDMQNRSVAEYQPALDLMPPADLLIADAPDSGVPRPPVLDRRKLELEALKRGEPLYNEEQNSSEESEDDKATDSTGERSSQESTLVPSASFSSSRRVTKGARIRISTIVTQEPSLETRGFCDAPDSSAFQSQKLNLCMDQVRKFEKNNYMEFDWVIRTRPDLRFLSPIGNLRDFDENYAYLYMRNNSISHGDTQDHFAILPRKLAPAYMDYDGCTGVAAPKVQQACAKGARTTWTESGRVTHECALNIRLRDFGVRIRPLRLFYFLQRCGVSTEECFDSETNPGAEARWYHLQVAEATGGKREM